MHKIKLICLLKTLTPQEFKDFSKFINSPFFNSNKQYLPLYKYLSKHYPNFDSPKLYKELVSKKCFPQKKYNANSFNNLMSGLAMLTEDYLLHIQLQKEKFEQKKLLLKAFSGRKEAYSLFQKSTLELVKDVESRPIMDMAYHQDLRALNHDFYFHPITNRQTIGSQGVQGIMDDLDIFYAQTKLLYLLEMKSRAYLFGEKYTFLLDEKIMLEKEVYFKQACPICLIYLKILKLYELVEDKKAFEAARNLFSEQMETIGKTERTVILLHLLNYCIRRINKGDLAYAKESLALYKTGLLYNILIEQGRMSEVTFSNIVSSGIKCKEYDWVKNFILKYKSYLDDEEKESTTLISLGLLNFAQEKYALVIDLLLNHPFDKPLQIVKVKSLLIRTYFEQFLQDDSYYELVMAQTYAFEKYIRRNVDISKGKSIAHLAFIQNTRRLIMAIIEKNISLDFLDSLQSSIPACKNWLLEKLKVELEKKGLPTKVKVSSSSSSA